MRFVLAGTSALVALIVWLQTSWSEDQQQASSLHCTHWGLAACSPPPLPAAAQPRSHVACALQGSQQSWGAYILDFFTGRYLWNTAKQARLRHAATQTVAPPTAAEPLGSCLHAGTRRVDAAHMGELIARRRHGANRK
jgi:hypothetical protein